MANGEFEDRERDELGELSEEIAEERGDLDTFNMPRRPQREAQFPELSRNTALKQAARSTGIGAPKLDYSVRSIFDARPVNAREFNIWVKLSATGNHSSPSLVVFNRSWAVPNGYVGLLREVQFITPVVPTPPEISGFVRILVDGAPVDPITVTTGPQVSTPPVFIFPQQTAIPIGRTGTIKTYQLADEGHWFGVDLQMPGATINVTEFYVGYFGQFLLKTGVPPLFQAANEAGRARTAATSPPPENTGTPSYGQSASAYQTRRRKRPPFAHVPIVNSPRWRSK